MEKSSKLNLLQTIKKEGGKDDITYIDPYLILKKEKDLLSDSEAIGKYLDIEKQGETAYFYELENFCEQLKQLPKECELSIVIPAYHEEQGIQHTLESIYKTTLDSKFYEIILVVNYPEGEVRDKTLDIVNNLKKKNKLNNLHIVEKIFNKKIAGVGAARKLGSDIALLRYEKRHDNSNFYIAGTDADIVTVPEDNYVQALHQLKETGADVLAGPVTIDQSLVGKLPEEFWKTHENLAVLIETSKQLTKVKESISKEFQSFSVTGPNYFIKASSYARIGGIPRLQTGEDIAISTRASNLGLRCEALQAQTITVSARRFIFDFNSMLAHTESIYGAAWFTEVSKKIRESGYNEETLLSIIKDIPDIPDTKLKDYIKNRLKFIINTIALQKNINVNLVLNSTIDIIKEKTEQKEINFYSEELNLEKLFST